ncbi:MAG: hypothetical protein K6G83_12600 [Lachnospiraceae bacterium]|nr:hypothetical protein [Lachnospiraceae bacterium]
MNRKEIFIIVMAALVSVMMGGCSNNGTPMETTKPIAATEQVIAVDPISTAEPEIPEKTDTVFERQDGERFEETIMLEGMEETVRYEHVRDEEIGFEMDYDYEAFSRHREPGRESFISIYDDPEKPENFLEVTYSPENADEASKSIEEELSENYDIIKETFELERAGSCVRIDASAAKGGGTPDLLQMLYIIPSADGSITATAHYSFEGAEGFGRRFGYIMNTLSLIDRSEKGKITEEQALVAIKEYCFAANPDLEGMEDSDDYTIYWDVSTNENGEIVVLYRSYTGAQIRYYIDPESGETYVTELVPEIIDEEQRTEEGFNVKDFL